MPIAPRKLVRFAATAALVLLTSYLLVVVAACSFQRDLLYFPDRTLTAPDRSGPAMQVVRLRTKDGETLVAWWRPPRDDRPVILHFGGNGDSLIDQGRPLAADRGRRRRV